jgi:MFS family permease
MLMVVWVLISGLVISWVSAHLPYWRSWLVVAIVGTMAASWAAVLLRNDPSPLWLLVVLVLTTATGGPASMVGFDLARSFVPADSSGRANGLVNGGGFFGALAAIGAIGVILQVREPGGMSAYGLDDFRVAMSVLFLGWALGVVQVLRYRQRGLAHLRREHPGAIETLKAGQPFAHPGFHDREGI